MCISTETTDIKNNLFYCNLLNMMELMNCIIDIAALIFSVSALSIPKIISCERPSGNDVDWILFCLCPTSCHPLIAALPIPLHLPYLVCTTPNTTNLYRFHFSIFELWPISAFGLPIAT